MFQNKLTQFQCHIQIFQSSFRMVETVQSSSPLGIDFQVFYTHAWIGQTVAIAKLQATVLKS